MKSVSGGSDSSGWRGKKDDEDKAFLHRVFFHAAKLVKSASAKRTRGGGMHR